MTNQEHLTKEQIDVILYLINQGNNFTYISQSIWKDKTTVSKEIRRNRYIKSKFYSEFDNKGISKSISGCNKLKNLPYVCNNCKNLRFCKNYHIFYNSTIAQKNYENTIKNSRTGVNISYEQIN